MRNLRFIYTRKLARDCKAACLLLTSPQCQNPIHGAHDYPTAKPLRGPPSGPSSGPRKQPRNQGAATRGFHGNRSLQRGLLPARATPRLTKAFIPNHVGAKLRPRGGEKEYFLTRPLTRKCVTGKRQRVAGCSRVFCQRCRPARNL